jgi:hypothetical protein
MVIFRGKYRKMLCVRAVIVGLFFVGWTNWGQAQDTGTSMKTRIVGLSLFKNGLGFVTREGTLPAGRTNVLMEDLPVPVHGTFWLTPSADDVKINNIFAFEKESLEPTPAITVAELLEANVGKTVELRVGDKDIIRGKILAVPAKRETPPMTPSARRVEYSPLSGDNPSLALIQTEEGIIAVNKQSISQMKIVGETFKTDIERKKKAGALRLDAANPGKGRLLVQYLTKGVTWAPSCAIDITDPKNARVTTKAEIFNEIEDFDGLTVNFITGFPNLQFAEVTDPIALQGDLAAFLNSLANPPQNRGGITGRNSVVSQQMVMSNYIDPYREETVPAYTAAAVAGQTREELFFYEQKGVSLKKGQRGYYPIYSVDVPYEHVYEWKIGDILDESERYRNDDRNTPAKTEEVWHSVKLTNTGKMPWTTAPAMTTQSGQIIGQDLIYYTSPGSKTTVRITQAVDIKADRAEYEVDRKRNAGNFYAYSYDLVELKGLLKATNYKDKDVTLTVVKNLSGEVVSVSPEAKQEKIAKGLRSVNPKVLLTWEVLIKAHEKVELEYQYKVYVRN